MIGRLAPKPRSQTTAVPQAVEVCCPQVLRLGYRTGRRSPRSDQVPTMANFTNAPTEGVYRGTTTITLNGVLLRPGQRLPPP